MKTQQHHSLMIVMLFFSQDLVFAQKIFLSPAGNDNNPGTMEKPFATLTAARDRAREHRKSNQVNQPIEIIALEGEYFMTEPLELEFPDDKNCRNNLHQYLLGRYLMVGIYNKNIYFPAGQWKDYWTGEVINGLQERETSWPDDRGGALYVRSGGIIPFVQLMQYIGEKPMNEITLYVFPDEKESTFELYEDDGVSFEHLNGKYSITHISAKLRIINL